MKKRSHLRSSLSLLLALVMVLSMLTWVMPGKSYAVEETEPEGTTPEETIPEETPSEETVPDDRSPEEVQEDLDKLEEEETALMEEITGLLQQQSANLTEIQAAVDQKNLIDQEIALLYLQAENSTAQIAAYNILIADKQDELDQAQIRLEELNEINRERIRTMEAEGDLTFWSVLFKATSFSDFLDRMNMMYQIAEADRRRIDEMNRVAEEIAAAQAQLVADKAALEETYAKLDQTQAELEAKRAEADAILAELVARGEEYQTLIEEGEDRVMALMDEIAQAEKEYNEARERESEGEGSGEEGGETPDSSGWIIPCVYERVSSHFNPGRLHPILGYVRPHNGIDLAAPTGTPVYATRSGTVTKVAYQADGAGNYVSINHGDGYSSIYMHLQRYIVSGGQYVQAGQLIGYVGSTGLSEGPHLHFGISYNGTYVNPANYMDF